MDLWISISCNVPLSYSYTSTTSFFLLFLLHTYISEDLIYLFFTLCIIRWGDKLTHAGQVSFCNTHYLKMCGTGQMRQSSWLKSDRFVSCCQTCFVFCFCFFFLPLFIPFHRKKPPSHRQAELRRTKIRQPLYWFNYNQRIDDHGQQFILFSHPHYGIVGAAAKHQYRHVGIRQNSLFLLLNIQSQTGCAYVLIFEVKNRWNMGKIPNSPQLVCLSSHFGHQTQNIWKF